MTRLSVVIAWTAIRGPFSRATAWRTHPVDWRIMPANHTGLCRIWINQCECPVPDVVSSVPRCCRTVPRANAHAARKARIGPLAPFT